MSGGRRLALALALCAPGCQPTVAPSESAAASIPASTTATSSADGDVEAPEWCRLSGAADALLRCPLGIALADATPSAAGLQLSLGWDAKRLALVGVESRVCPPGVYDSDSAACGTVMAPPLKSVGPGGHSLATRPVNLATAAGAATIMIYHASNPNAPLALELGSVVFRALEDVAGTPVRVSDAVATSPKAASLVVEAVPGRLSIGPPDRFGIE